MPAFNTRYPPGPPVPRNPSPFTPSGAGGPLTPVPSMAAPATTPLINMFGSSATGTPLVNNFGAPSPATAFGTPSLLQPRTPFSAAQTTTAPQPYLATNGPTLNRPGGGGGVLRPRYPTANQFGQPAAGGAPAQSFGPGPSAALPSPTNGPQPQQQQQQQFYPGDQKFLPPQSNGPSLPHNGPMPPSINGPMPPSINGPMPPSFNGPMPPPPINGPVPPSVGGPMPPPPINGPMPPAVNGPRPPPPINGPMPPSVNGPMLPPSLNGPMPPQPARNNGSLTATGGEGGRFGGDMQSLGASLGGLSVTQSGKLSPL
jgi:hypothetical protein